MYRVFEPSPDLFSAMIAVDVIVANIWLAFLLYGAGISGKMDRFFRADASAVNDLKQKMEDYQQSITRVPKLNDTMIIIGIALGATGLSHLLADLIAPWLAVQDRKSTRLNSSH